MEGVLAPPRTKATSSFEDLARRELPVLYRVARRLTAHPAEAEDLVGQTLLAASRGWDRFDGRHPRSWLIRILRNAHAANDRAGRARPVAAPEVDVETLADEPWDALEWRLVGPELLAALQGLPEDFRLAVALCDVEEMSYEEVAASLDIAVGTVKSRVFRGRRLLRARLAHFFPLEENPPK